MVRRMSLALHCWKILIWFETTYVCDVVAPSGVTSSLLWYYALFLRQ